MSCIIRVCGRCWPENRFGSNSVSVSCSPWPAIGIRNRWVAKAILPEVLKRLEHGESNLYSFYSHIESKHNELREKLKAAKV